MSYQANGRVLLSVSEAQALGEETLKRAGFDSEEARIITDHVMDAALCGYEYSGLPKILNVVENPKLKKPRRKIRILHDTPVSARLDGGNHNGMLAMYRAMRLAMDKAAAKGFALVSLYDSWTSGRSGYYTELAAREGLVCLHTASGHPSVAPPGAMEGATGTNPISFAFPTRNEPFVIDMGTSAYMGSDLQFRARRGEPIPEGVAIDGDGNPTTDSRKAEWLLPLAGHKGFALAMAIQSLGVLGGATDPRQKGFGYFIVAFKPDLLMPFEDYLRDMDEMLAKVRAVKRMPGVANIRLPSENSFATRRRLRDEGIVIDQKIYEALKAVPQGVLPEPT